MQFDYRSMPRSLYLHWPFCPYKCHFCPFVALASQDQHMQQYHDRLIKEIEAFGQLFDHKPAIETIFLGGGTPSTYPDALLLDTSATLKRFFEIDTNGEITIEVNPGTVRHEQMNVWREAGINRLSIGVQSLKDQSLKKLNRHQTAQDVYRLLELVQGKFENVSIDLILGLPEVSSEEWKQLIREIVTWPIKHLSMYFLTVHEDTPLYFKVKQQHVALPCDDTMIDLYYWSIDTLKDHGFMQYEISNFAKPGFESRHNSMYWYRKPYKAFGLGACSFDGSTRFQNEKNLMKYMHAVATTGQATTFCETLTTQQVHLERVMLGIRQAKGVLVSDIMDGLTSTDQQKIVARIDQLMEYNFIKRENDRLVLTPRGLSVENEIAIKLSL